MALERRYYIYEALAVLILTVLLVVGSCQEREVQPETADRYIVGVVTKSGTSEYWMTVRRGMEEAAEKMGIEIILLSPDSETNEEAQAKMVETLVKKGVDAIAVSPIDSYQNPAYFDMAEEKGIPVISYDTGFADMEIPYIGIDNEKAGYEMAQCLAEEIGHKGEVGIVSGSLDQICHRQRVEGFKAYMDTEPEIDVAFIESGYSNLRMSERKIRKLREEYPSVEGIAATSAVTAMGIAEGIADHTVRIVSIDVQEDALNAVKDGRITALIAQSGYDIGYRTIRYINKYRNGNADGLGEILEAELLTEQNVEAYMEKEYTE